MSDYDTFYEDNLEEMLEEKSQHRMEAFNLTYATDAQEQAIRDYASEVGFTDLRHFRKWRNEAGLDYYDILKIQSPDD